MTTPLLRAHAACVALLLAGLGACRAIHDPLPPGRSPSPLIHPMPVAEGEEVVPVAPIEDPDVDRILLTSGEWLRGEVLGFDDDVLTFDSVVLDDQDLDWEDVAGLFTERPFTVLLADREAIYGILEIERDEVRVRGPAGLFAFDRDDLVRLVPGLPSEANYWSGEIRLSSSTARGNTDTTDASAYASLKRETAATRMEVTYDEVYSEVDGDKTADNLTIRERFDVFLSPSLYVTPLGFEYFEDRFQNIERRTTPYVGLGYEAVQTRSVDLEFNGGLGYRTTHFISTAPGEPDVERTGSILLGTNLEYDVTSDIEFNFDYEIQVGLDDTKDTNQSAEALLSLDITGDLDLDLRVKWKRVGMPQKADDGTTPDKNDTRVEVGLSWEF